MPGSFVLDIVLGLVLLSYLVYGLSAGVVVSLAGLLGIVVGAIAAFFAIPLVTLWVADSGWRVPLVLLTALVLLVVGQVLGLALGKLIRRGFERTPLRVVDRVLGGLLDVVVAALLMSMLAFSVSSLGVPFISQAIAGSRVISTIDGITPDPVKAALAQLRSIAVEDGIPAIGDAIASGGTGTVTAPDTETNTSALNLAAQSVVKITGNAYQCGQNQSGSGFVVAPGRVVTNAHVVAGVTRPVVEAPGGGAYPGRVVFFDPARDLAVIAASGLPAKALQLSPNLAPGAAAVFDGYPLGGPFRSSPATVQSVPTVEMKDIYGQNPSPRQLYYLAATVQEGNSGGPLLTPAGKVAGVIFAKSTQNPGVGYALTTQELSPVASQAASLSSPVQSGTCIRG
jgi:S1-C subfamily serine protease